MKKTNLLIPVLALSLFGWGCSKTTSVKEDASSPAVIDIDDLIGGNNGGGTTPVAGENAATLVTTYAQMNAYVAMRPLNNPTNIKVTVDLQKDSRDRYYGAVMISYMDNGSEYRGVFQSGNAENYGIKYANGNKMYEHDYNYWWMDHNAPVFSGYFQDQWGGLVLVIDRVTTQGNNDGMGKTVLSGSVWYRNFPTVQSTQSPYRKCWFISLGPFDCRSTSVTSKNAIYPADTYTKLGTFTGLSKSATFKTSAY
ncbi:MAG: hypothetical protein KF789_09740 [Bdellovibrionaceae bacterium]|nr:hypothetical protein [Pseudobdellovibrionaceae bacterium]